jgi:hypothetical protein
MATSDQVLLASGMKRISTLLRRLATVRNSSVEAELITQLTLETEAVRQVQATLRGDHRETVASPKCPLSGLAVDFAPSRSRQSRSAGRPRVAARET